MDSGRVALLALLDVSAAFDSVDHQILLTRLATSYGISGRALAWFCSYLEGRTMRVEIEMTSRSGRLLFVVFLRTQSWGHYFSFSTQLTSIML